MSLSKLFDITIHELLNELWNSDKTFYQILIEPTSLIEIRNKTFAYLDSCERRYFNIYADDTRTNFHIIERNGAKECIRVLKNVFRTENEQLTGTSALDILVQSAQGNEAVISGTSKGFYCEFIYLLNGMNLTKVNFIFNMATSVGSLPPDRPERLDAYATLLNEAFSKFCKGSDPDQLTNGLELKKKILQYFDGDDQTWNDYLWHMQHLICDKATIQELVTLEPDELAGLDLAEKYGIHVQITPYYLSLFNKSGRTIHDRALRAQVIPSEHYCRHIEASRQEGGTHDFMGEQYSSPIAGTTRRYPQIIILKPYDSCPQICVYCQRNWEITGIHEATTSRSKIEAALQWIGSNNAISEVLVTGGDPLTLSNEYLEWIISSLAAIPHIDRIRIGTRTLVTLPFRFTDELIAIFERHHQWGSKEIAIMTHCEHALEITPDVLHAVRRIKKAGLNIYNQQVFTYYNSRRFETCYLRKTCKLSGVDPYYSFNTKGKNETIDFRVPIARIEQERKEEARLLPGLDRTDEPVFNIPRLGKSHLRAWQDHEPVMIRPDGTRVYRFYPWESRLAHENVFLYTDVSIYDYLQRLRNDGENIDNYDTIWFYF